MVSFWPRQADQSGWRVTAQRSRNSSSSGENAFTRSLSTSIVPTIRVPDRTGTTASAKVALNVVRYRESCRTSLTMSARPEATAAPLRPCALGNVGYAGGVGPVQPIARISDGVTSYRPTQWKLRARRMHSAASLARVARVSPRAAIAASRLITAAESGIPNGHYHVPHGLRQGPRASSNFAIILTQDLR
jgi:hypothetical protein